MSSLLQTAFAGEPFASNGPLGLSSSLPVRKAQAAAGDAPIEEKKYFGIGAFTWQKIIPLGAMFFCILFNYTILRDTKACSRPCSACYHPSGLWHRPAPFDPRAQAGCQLAQRC